MHQRISTAQSMAFSELVRQFGPPATGDKSDFLNLMLQSEVGDGETLCNLYDACMFLLAFPDSPAIENLAEKLLQQLRNSADFLYQKGRIKDLNFLEESAIRGTSIAARFTRSLVSYLSNEFPVQVFMHSMQGDDTRVRDTLLLCLPSVLQDILPAGTENLVEWLENQANAAGISNIKYLLNLIEGIDADEKVKDQLFESLEVYTGLRFDPGIPDRAAISVPTSSKRYVKAGLQKKPEPAGILKKPAPKEVRLSLPEKEELMLASRLSLLTLSRETDSVTFASAENTSLFDMGDGLQIALFGLPPNRRQAIETYVGYMAFANGIPCSYGGAWCFHHSALIGLNIYEAFRGGESARLCLELMRVYQTVCGITHFRVEPYQLGEGNDDGLHSGVYWFYYRLGYRPESPKLAIIAESEWKKISSKKGYRPTAATMKKLISGHMHIRLTDDMLFVNPAELMQRVAKLNMTAGVPELQSRKALLQMKSIFQTHQIRVAFENRNVQKHFEDLSMLFQHLPGLDSLPKSKAKALYELMQGKGNNSHLEFLKQWQKMPWMQEKWADFLKVD